MVLAATSPIRARAEPSDMNAERAREAAGRHIEVLFTDEDQSLFVDLGEGDADEGVAAALIDCLEAPTVDDAEMRLHAGLDGLDGTVRRAP